jgi:dTDP-4-dehydrorhamnose 3,5-epimerase-like enzyme
MIENVKTKNLRVIPDERGWLMKILRCDEDLFEKFGQVYFTTVYPGVIKAWHLHKKQRDNFTCVNGMVKVALYDARKNSPTYGEVNEFLLEKKIQNSSAFQPLSTTVLRPLVMILHFVLMYQTIPITTTNLMNLD